jgi:hypothetical protein
MAGRLKSVCGCNANQTLKNKKNTTVSTSARPSENHGGRNNGRHPPIAHLRGRRRWQSVAFRPRPTPAPPRDEVRSDPERRGRMGRGESSAQGVDGVVRRHRPLFSKAALHFASSHNNTASPY